ncbi:hypothetical protein P170DRAFT_428183 [Aspergillus steynii IBT 23096]|uniref:Uncharacterized protein n=1 Tax=Aspergillus steynii IBT 23096 TaxID=1392250 RepID=A0A2I2G214_9EURO|nr:uncharacterized protein P170DRAFT_428183 [Aspergillus steynii IBT 23096]PLB46923.1 hypothetical protein P170DRAFT_428183 [Aspergillus steynii IBT 23096]
MPATPSRSTGNHEGEGDSSEDASPRPITPDEQGTVRRIHAPRPRRNLYGINAHNGRILVNGVDIVARATALREEGRTEEQVANLSRFIDWLIIGGARPDRSSTMPTPTPRQEERPPSPPDERIVRSMYNRQLYGYPPEVFQRDPFIQTRQWQQHVRRDRSPPLTPREREERRAERVAIPPAHMDNEPSRDTWPIGWELHHDYYLWACRGTVVDITEQLQVVFDFNPPIQESFVADRLSGVNAFRQLTYLQTYFPGETQSMQRALARGVIYEANIDHAEIRGGFQELEVEQEDPANYEYPEPACPSFGPEGWNCRDDAYLALYLGESPSTFIHDYGWLFPDPICPEFIRLRMAQIPYLDLSSSDLQRQVRRRERFFSWAPHRFADIRM